MRTVRKHERWATASSCRWARLPTAMPVPPDAHGRAKWEQAEVVSSALRAVGTQDKGSVAVSQPRSGDTRQRQCPDKRGEERRCSFQCPETEEFGEEEEEEEEEGKRSRIGSKRSER